TLAYLTRFLLRRVEPVYALAFIFLAGAMMAPSLLSRPHVIVWPLTAVWVGTLVECSERRRAPPWWLLGVLVLWTNLHGSFVMALALAGAIAADAVPPGEVRWQTARRWALFLLVAAACTLINPHGYRAITFAFDLMSMKVLPLIDEWRSPNLQG